MRRRPFEWENIFAKEVMDKGLTSKIEEQLMELNIKNNKQHNQKMGGRPKKIKIRLFKEEILSFPEYFSVRNKSLLKSEHSIPSFTAHFDQVEVSDALCV